MRPLLYLVVSVLMLCVCCTRRDNAMPRSRQPQDTLYTSQAAMAIYDRQPHRALMIIDSAQARGNVPDHIADLLRAQIFSRSSAEQHFDTARVICERLLRHDEVKDNPDNRFNVLDMLVYISRQTGNDEQYLYWATQLVTLCREQHSEVEALRTESEIGLVMTRLGQFDEGLDIIDNAINRLEAAPGFNALDASIIATKRKINALCEHDDYAQVVPLARRIITRLEDYEHSPEKYRDNSYREPDGAVERADYIAFYRAQAHAFLAIAYARMGDIGNARRYCDLFEQSSTGKTPAGHRMIVEAWFRLGDYGKMLMAFDEIERAMAGDTVNVEYLHLLKYRAMMADDMGRQALSQRYWERYAALARKVNEYEMTSRALDYAARYRLQESQARLRQREAEAQRDWLLAVASFVFFIIAVGFAVYFYRQKRIIDRKNSVIAEQMAEAIKYKEMYFARVVDEKPPVEPAGKASAPARPAPQAGEVDGMTDGQLFVFLSDVIERERLFLNADFGRQTLADRFQLSNHRIGLAFSQGSRHGSLPRYIREVRLRYASEMLLSHPEMSIGEVASASGFNNVSGFNRDFKNRYTVSPTEYRSMGRDNAQ